MVQNPVLERVSSSSSKNKTTVTISWKPIEGAGYFYAGVFNPDNQSVAHQMVNSSNGSNLANIQNITLDSSTAYTAKVAQCDASGKLTSAYSRPLNVLQNPLTNLSTHNNLNSIDIMATLPTVGNATGMNLTLIDSSYNVLANNEVTGNSGTITPTTPLSPSKTYLLYAAPTSNGGTSEGPSSEINLVMNEVDIKKVTYDGNNLTILSDKNLPSGYLLFGAWMTGNDTVTGNTGSESSVSMTHDWKKLNHAKTYTVLIRAEQNGSYGPSSQATPIVVTPANLRTASFTDNNVGVTWDVPPVSPIPTGGTIAAIANGSVAGTPEESLGYKGNIDIPSVDAVTSLLVQVNSVYGVAYGPPASTDIPFTAPTISALSFTAGKINVAWNAVDSVPGYRLTLNDSNGKPISSIDTTDTQAALPAALDENAAYKVSVQAYGESNGILLSGPLSTEVAAISALPRINKVNYDGTKVTVIWDAVSNTAGISGYSAQLLDPQTLSPIGEPGIISGANKTSTSITAILNAYSRYLVAVQATGANTRGVFGETVEVISAAPTLSAIANDSRGLTLSWDPLMHPAVTGYTIGYKNSAGKSKSLQVAGTSTRLPTGSTTITVAACGDLVTGPATAAPANALTAPAISSVGINDGKIIVVWGAVNSAPGYRLYLNDSNGKPISFIDTTDTQAALPAALDENAAYKVSVQAYGESNGILLSGPLSTEVAAITALPVINKLTTDRITNKSTLDWHAVSGANQYLINFSTGDEPVIVTSTNYTFPEPMIDKIDLSLTITAQAKTTGETVSGPRSLAFKFPGKQPAVAKVYFNGLTASIKWNLIDTATGYTAAVLETRDGKVTEVKNNTVSATKNNTDIDFTIDAAASYQIVVQALFGDSSGPTSQAMPLFENGIFPSNSPSTNCFPFVYPATELAQVMQADTAKSGIPLTLYLPDIGAGTALTNLPYTVGAFTLAAYDGTGKENYPYTLTISNTVDTNNPWKFDSSPVRTPIQNDYVNFLKGAETNGVKNWGINQLQQIIARAMPQTFAELLYYNYGLNFQNSPVKGSADLRPGMILRVSINPFQMVTSQNSQSWNNGFIGGPVIDYEIGSLQNPNGSWGVGFDAFISQLVSNGVLSVNPPEANSGSGKEQGIADVADLYFPAFREPFYRLFIPSTLITASSTGSIQTADNFVLAAASDYTALTTSTNTPGSGLNVAYFRGRAVIRLCIRITVNDEAIVVPIGTTVGNLLERSNQLPSAVNLPLSGITLKRPLGSIALDPGDPLDINNHYPVRLDWQGMAIYGANSDVLDMPVLAGDQLSIENDNHA